MHKEGIVLIIANDLSRADALVDLLGGFGARLEVAIGGSAGILVAMTEVPDAAVIDTGMADIDGWRVAETLRMQFETRDMALLGVSWGAEVDPNPRRRPVFDRQIHFSDAADSIAPALREVLQLPDAAVSAGVPEDATVLPVTLPVEVKKVPALVKVPRKRVNVDAIVSLPPAVTGDAKQVYFAKWPGTAWFAILPSMVATIKAAGAEVLTSSEMASAANSC